MLDKGTMEWPMNREQIEIANGLYYCAYCGLFSDNYFVFTGYCIGEYYECPLVPDYRDAAEFEARVARCATIDSYLTIGDIPFECIKKQSIQELALMAARLQVEKEMEEQNDR